MFGFLLSFLDSKGIASNTPTTTPSKKVASSTRDRDASNCPVRNLMVVISAFCRVKITNSVSAINPRIILNCINYILTQKSYVRQNKPLGKA